MTGLVQPTTVEEDEVEPEDPELPKTSEVPNLFVEKDVSVPNKEDVDLKGELEGIVSEGSDVNSVGENAIASGLREAILCQ